MMETDTILIRAARMEDGVQIQRLLHSDYKWLSIEQITNCLDQLFVVFYGSKLISVTCLKADGSGWTSVHPLFPQGLLESGTSQLLKGVGLDKPVYGRPKRHPQPLPTDTPKNHVCLHTAQERPGI